MSDNEKSKKVTNKNNNLPSSWLRLGDLAYNEMCAPFIPSADWLIARHSKRWWKNHPECGEYQRAQFGICTFFLVPYQTKEWTCRLLAISLDCDALPLMNDKETLDLIPEFTDDHLIIAKKIAAL